LGNFFERNGLEISRATQSDVADLAHPLYDLMVQRMLASHLVYTDATIMPCCGPA
jgi:hypothetical protein